MVVLPAWPAASLDTCGDTDFIFRRWRTAALWSRHKTVAIYAKMEFLPAFVLSPSVFVLAWHFHILHLMSVFVSGKKTFPCALICTICLFKLAGNLGTRQSVPWAGISAAASETYLNKSNTAIRQGVFSVKQLGVFSLAVIFGNGFDPFGG